MAPNTDLILGKLLERTESDDLRDIVRIAIELLPLDDERTAAQLLNAILLHDDLAETLDGRL